MKTLRPCLAEFLGTFYLCFAGIAAILCNTPSVGGNSGLLGIALAHGLALSVAVNVFGGESGAHFNPAVTCGFLVTGRIKTDLAFAYIGAQLLGATVAAGFCRTIFPVEASHAMKFPMFFSPGGGYMESVAPTYGCPATYSTANGS